MVSVLGVGSFVICFGKKQHNVRAKILDVGVALFLVMKMKR